MQSIYREMEAEKENVAKEPENPDEPPEHEPETEGVDSSRVRPQTHMNRKRRITSSSGKIIENSFGSHLYLKYLLALYRRWRRDPAEAEQNPREKDQESMVRQGSSSCQKDLWGVAQGM